MNTDLIAQIFMALTVLFSITVVFARQPIVGAISLTASLLTTAVLFLILGAQFVAITQVLVYAGGILVLFIYILMLLGVKSAPWGKIGFAFTTVIAGLIAAAMGRSFWNLFSHEKIWAREVPSDFGSIEFFGKTLLEQYAYPFELISLLLLAVIVAVVVLSRKEEN